MATKSSLSSPFSGSKGGELRLTTVKANIVLVGAKHTGADPALLIRFKENMTVISDDRANDGTLRNLARGALGDLGDRPEGPE